MPASSCKLRLHSLYNYVEHCKGMDSFLDVQDWFVIWNVSK